MADVIANEMLVIHDLAVSPPARRTGIGSQLANAAIDDGRASNASIVALIYQRRSPGLAAFYSQLGFRSFAPAQRLELTFGALPGITVGFPQEDPGACWAVLPLSSTRVQVATS